MGKKRSCSGPQQLNGIDQCWNERVALQREGDREHVEFDALCRRSRAGSPSIVPSGWRNLYDLVYALIFARCLAPFWGVLAAREGAEQQQYLRARLRAGRLEDLRDALGDLVGVVATGVVRADHEDDDLRLDAVHLTVLDAPEHVLRAVAAPPCLACWRNFS